MASGLSHGLRSVKAVSDVPDPYAALPDGAFDKAFEVAEALADRLESDGWICGHPYREDVTAVISKLYLAGLLVPGAVAEPSSLEREQ